MIRSTLHHHPSEACIDFFITDRVSVLTTSENTMNNANNWEQSLLSQQDQDGEIIEPWWGTFNILDENIVGLPSDRPPQHVEVLSVIRMLEDAEISCCIVEEYALIYYGAGRVQNVSLQAWTILEPLFD